MKQEISIKTQVGVASFCLFLLALFLTAYSARNPSVARIGNALVLEVVAPVSHVARVARDGVSNVWSRYFNLLGAARQNEELAAKVSDLEGRLTQLAEFELENSRLRRLLNFTSERQLRGVIGAVIGGDPSGWVKGIVVDRGSAHGVRPGMPVVHSRGVVGQVASVSSYSSRVLLVSDHSSGVDVLVQDTRARGVLEGAGDRVCQLTFVTTDTPVKAGDTVVTSGMDRVYPKGLVVGTVSQVRTAAGALFQSIEVKPVVDFSRLEEVLIVFSKPDAVVPGEKTGASS